MASTIVAMQLPSGLSSPTLSLYADGSDTLANTGGADTLTEATNRKGLYTATVTEALTGLHFAKVLSGANVIGTGFVILADDTNTYTITDSRQALSVTGSVGSVLGGINTSGGTITTLDALDTAQDSQHNGTQSSLSGIGSEVSAILTDTGTTLPGTLSTIDGKVDGNSTALSTLVTSLGADTPSLHSKIDTVDGVVDAIKVKTDGLNFTGTDVQSIASSISGVTFPTNFGDMAITETDGYTSANLVQIVGQAAEALQLRRFWQATEARTVASASGTTITLSSVTADDQFNRARVVVISGTGVGQSAIVVDSDATANTLTIDEAMDIPPDNTSTVMLFPDASIQTQVAAIATNVTTLVTKLATGITNSLVRLLGVIAGKSTGSPALDDLADLQATPGGATYDNTTDSAEAIRDRGDAEWTTGGGGSGDDPLLLQSTTIATLASQTSFTLTAGSADDDAYNDAIAVVIDSATSEQVAFETISDYVGSTKTVTLAADPAVFTMAVGDTIKILAPLGSSGGGLTQQQVADAGLLAPSGTPAAGSQAADLDTLITRTASGVTVTTSGAADTNGDIATPIKRGDAYNGAAGNEFTVTSSGFPAAVWDSASVVGTLKILDSGTWVETGSVAVTHDSDQTVTATISFTTAQTTALTASDKGTRYEVELSVGSNHRTLDGRWKVESSDE